MKEWKKEERGSKQGSAERKNPAKVMGNQAALSLEPGILQCQRWQRHGGYWYEIGHEERGGYPLPAHAGEGVIFDDVTGETFGPVQHVVFGAGSGQNEARELAGDRRAARHTVVSDLQTEEELRGYAAYEASQAQLRRAGAMFMPGLDATYTFLSAPEVRVPFLDTGTRRPTAERPPTSRVMHDIFTRQSEMQSPGDTIEADIYMGSHGQYPMGQRYKIAEASGDAGYSLTSREAFDEVPEHEKTRDHSSGVAFTKDTIAKLHYRHD